MNNDEDLIKDLFSNYIQDELNHPEVQLAKKTLIRNYFQESPKIFFGVEMMAPAIALFSLFFIFNQIQLPVRNQVAPALQSAQVDLSKEIKLKIPINEKKTEPKKQFSPDEDGVLVKKVSSSVGPTMVYQKKYENVPVTIVWVFMGGSH